MHTQLEGGLSRSSYQSDVFCVMLVGEKEVWVEVIGRQILPQGKTNLLGSRIFRNWNSHVEREQDAGTEGLLAT